MKSYVCMFNDKTLADDVVGTACEVGFDAMTRAVTWNRSNGTVAVTYGVMAEEVERNQVLDLVPNHQGGGHSDLLRCPTCTRPTLEPLRRHGRGRFNNSLKRFRRRERETKPPVFCRYCRREMQLGEGIEIATKH
jgi:hypothetical protein